MLKGRVEARDGGTRRRGDWEQTGGRGEKYRRGDEGTWRWEEECKQRGDHGVEGTGIFDKCKVRILKKVRDCP